MIAASAPQLAELLAAQLEVFPAHESYLRRRFAGLSDDDLAFCELLAGLLQRICGGELRLLCEDYRWLAGAVLEEELFFRRHGRYRLSTFREALAEVYDDPVYMRRYMSGVLATQVWWRNHTDVLKFYRDRYLASFRRPVAHLEVGPGHGLFLYLAARAGCFSSLSGYDVSAASIDASRRCLAAMGVEEDVRLERVDLLSAPAGAFGSITFSEVLEHLEDPQGALSRLRDMLEPGGRIFVNAPVNSPAPDHIHLFRTPEEVIGMVEGSGLKVVDTFMAPVSGASLADARRRSLTISTVVVAEREVRGA